MRRRSGVILGVVATVASAVAVVVLPNVAHAAVSCQVTYTTNDWQSGPGQGGFTGNVVLNNVGDPLTSWTLRFAFPGSQQVTQGWGATWTQSGANVSATNLSWNGNLATGASISIGFNANWTGSNPKPTSFSVNNITCNGGTGPSPSASASASPSQSTSPGNRPPAVNLTSPTAGSTFTAPATINFAATASDPDGTVSRVEFYNGTTLVGSDTTSPYSFAWTGVAAGTYAVRARSIDNAGSATFTDPISVTVTGGGTTGAAPALHVSGNRLLTASGATYRLLGVNRSGGEFACIQGNGTWDGPMDQASITAMRTWKVRTVRVPLNEECWLATSNVPAGGTSGAAYQQAVKDYVSLLITNGITPIVEMHWNFGNYTGNSAGACPQGRTEPALCQKPMPDAQFAPSFWTGVANAFKGNNAVVFDLFNEPFPERATGSTATGWTCWRDGGTCAGIPYQVAGFQSLVNAVRATGATNVIMIGGLAFSNDLTQWLQFKPTDPQNNLMAFAHVYNFNSCSNTGCYDSTFAPVAAQVPLGLTEIGENDCQHSFIDTLMTWADAHGVGYLGWTWNTWPCTSGPALITDYNGTATAFGQGLKDRLNTVSN